VTALLIVASVAQQGLGQQVLALAQGIAYHA